MPTLPKGALKNSITWAASGTALQIAAQFVALIGLARLLTAADFGIVSVAMLITQLALVFTEFGVAPYVVQRATLSDGFIGMAFRLSCLFGGLLAGIVWFLAPVLASLMDVPELEEVLRVYCIVFLIKGWSAVQEALLQRDLNFRYLARSDGWSFGVGYAVVSLACAYAGFSFWSLVAGHVAQSAIKAGFMVIRHPEVSLKPADGQTAREMLFFGSGQTLSRLGSYLGSQADSFVVAISLGVVPIGYYGRANQLVTMPTFYVGQVFDKVIFPVVALIQGDRREVSLGYQTAVGAISMLSVPMAIGIAVFSEEIVALLLGGAWTDVAAPMSILALAIPFRLLHKVSDPTARGLGATYARAWRQWVFAILVSLMAFLAIPYGLAGVATAVVLASVIDAILMVGLCMKLADIRVGAVLRSVIPATRLGGVTLATCLASLWCARRAEFNSLGTLLLGGAITTTLLSLFAWKRPELLWGNSGTALISAVLDRR